MKCFRGQGDLFYPPIYVALCLSVNISHITEAKTKYCAYDKMAHIHSLMLQYCGKIDSCGYFLLFFPDLMSLYLVLLKRQLNVSLELIYMLFK